MLRNVLRLFWVSLVLVSACAPRHFEMPSVIGGDIRSALEEKRSVTDIETTFSIVFEKAGGEIHGDGALTISNSGDLDLRVYSLGFLALELTARDGVVRSSPGLDRAKKLILSEGLRDCIFWWNMEDSSVSEEDEAYVIGTGSRRVWVDKKSFLPLRQVVYLGDGKELKITYQDPVRENGLWYQSGVRIEYSSYAVSLGVRSVAVQPRDAACFYCSL